MNLFKKVTVALAASAMVAAPVASSAQSGDDGFLDGESLVLAGLAAAAIIGGVIIAAGGSSSRPTSP